MNKRIKGVAVSLSIALCSAFCAEAGACTDTPVSVVRTAVQRVEDNYQQPEALALSGDLLDIWFDMCPANRRQRQYLTLLRPLISRSSVNGDVALMINDVWRDARFFAADARKASLTRRRILWAPSRVMSTGPEIPHLWWWKCLSARLNNRPIPINACKDLDEASHHASNPNEPW